ncbi:MAG: ABC transporter ATP-binding protein, partial [Candidatus Omnitrophica bacterium]|nr:ABC transporter ATP-binding protein [Candidatus Omnitrophota bacterium]
KTGVVFLDEVNLSLIRQKEIARRIGVVPQNSTNRFPFTVFDTVLMGRFPHLGRFDKEKKEDFDLVDRSLRITDISHLASRLITEISGGEHQKVIIARALAQEPKVLLLDEPTLHLDINHQMELLELLRVLAKKESLIIVMVSHDLNLAARYADRILILKEGEIYRAGLPEKILTPLNIREVYGIEVEIFRSSAANSLNIIPISTVKR